MSGQLLLEALADATNFGGFELLVSAVVFNGHVRLLSVRCEELLALIIAKHLFKDLLTGVRAKIYFLKEYSQVARGCSRLKIFKQPILQNSTWR